jgi:DNA-binding response OmpR family regulator
VPAAASPQTAVPVCEERVEKSTPGPRVLCIDDDPEISKLLKLRLAEHGVDVLRAFNGMQGYWTALDMRPEVIILDLQMPDGHGNYIVGRLKMHPLTAKIPILVLTGKNTPATQRLLFAQGIDGYLTKPLDFNALLEYLRQHIPLTNAGHVQRTPDATFGMPTLVARELPNFGRNPEQEIIIVPQ